jgi:S-adenosyl methyltransferase
VDYDPVVLTHARAAHQRWGGSHRLHHADLRDTPAILGQARELLDFTQPAAITLIAILHGISDSDDPHAIVASLLDAVPPGSYLAISHMGADLIASETLREMKDVGKRLRAILSSGPQPAVNAEDLLQAG